MLKKRYIILLFLFANIGIFAQKNDTIPTWSYKLEGQAWKDWDSINHIWMKDVYWPCLKENKLKMSCANCVYIYIDASFTIDSSGKVIQIIVVKENVCSRKASKKLKKCFFDYFINMVFPESLRNRKIKSKFGTGLSC